VLEPHLAGLVRARRARTGRLRLERIDVPCTAIFFPGPHSYTGEDCAEIQLPGNPLLLERAIDALLASARSRDLEARRAEPGEFTARAFFNGRISLTGAEGVAATIAALSDGQLKAAQLLRSGAIGTLARALADDLAEVLALVEAGIDFSDQDDVAVIDHGELAARLDSLRERIETHLRRASSAEEIEAVPWVLITGAPNAGKSTLFNALLGRPRAVVSDVPGTTRDVLAEPLTIETPAGNAEVMLVDAAGTSASDSPLERLMQDAAGRAAERSELRLCCVPVGAPTRCPGGSESARGVGGSGELLVRTKADLRRDASVNGLAVSVRSGLGLEALRREIGLRLGRRSASLAADAVALGPRHQAALRQASDRIEEAASLAAPSGPARPELVAAALRLALDQIGQMSGDIAPDDVLGRIFSRFCVGK
jgi:tRNA modification GTPase